MADSNPIKSFFRSKAGIIFINLLLALLVVGLVIWGTLFALDTYTRHGQKIAVPNLVGLHIDDAVKVLKSKDLTYEVTDTVYNEEFEPWAIMSQKPIPESFVKEDRTIYLIVRQPYPDPRAVPEVLDKSEMDAEIQLQQNGFKIGERIETPNAFKGIVVGLEYNGKDVYPGDTLYKGSMVSLVVGSGTDYDIPAEEVDLTGLTVEEAVWALKARSLYLGSVVTDVTVLTTSDSLKAKIYKQIPEPKKGEQIKAGQYVDVFISLKEPIISSDTSTLDGATETVDTTSD